MSGWSQDRYKIDELADLVHPRDSHPKIFAMIEAYLDESGIHGGAAICVIGGYFGGRGAWRRFEKKWKEVLAYHKIPMDQLHAKDLLKKDDPKLKALASSLTKTIAGFRSKIHSITGAIIVEDFNSFSLNDRKFMTGATFINRKLSGSGSPDKPYYVPFQHCLRRVAEYAPVGGKAHFFFGLDRDFSRYATDLYAKAKNDPRYPFSNLGDISFPLAKETAQLQAADLLVHLTYQFAKEMIENGTWGRIYPSGLLADAIAGTVGSSDHFYVDRRSLELTLTKGIEKFYGKARQETPHPAP